MWYVYILQCADGTLYTGMTDDLNSCVNGPYARSRLPVKLLYQERFFSRNQALRREARIRRMTRQEKEALCEKA